MANSYCRDLYTESEYSVYNWNLATSHWATYFNFQQRKDTEFQINAYPRMSTIIFITFFNIDIFYGFSLRR